MNVESIWKQGFSVFCKFLSDEVETILGKDTQSVQNYLNQNMGIKNFLENGFGAKADVAGIWEKHFSVFCKFLSVEVQTIFEKVMQSVQNYSDQNLGITTFLQKYFGANLRLKTNFLRFSKKHFPDFCKFLTAEVETICCKSEARRSRLFKSKFRHRKLLR